MPELPEVETIKLELQRTIKGKVFSDVWSDSPKQISPGSAKFKKQIKGKKILDIKRRAKVLIFKLSSDLFLVIHLKLTGQLIFRPKKGRLVYGGHSLAVEGGESLPNKFTQVYFTFTDGSKLFFNDLRKFGWVRLVNKEQVNKLASEFGIEPLSKEYTLENFKKILERRKNKKIKQILMEQGLIAGLGNIYTDESCFCAKIKPTRLAKSLEEKEIKDLFNCIPKILKAAISKKGTSANTYVQLSGEEGGYISYLKVYGREGQKCGRCGGTIKKIRLGGRGTHYCNKCQK